MRVLAAMSGGVDSAVAAARAVAAGHEVVGVHLALSADPATLRTGSRGCCSREDAGDARRVADLLGIPFYVWDFAERFRADVIDDFVESYSRGETPNPCLRCNERIKFEALLDRGMALGFDAVATGHYALLSTEETDTGHRRPVLRRAVDPGKDQSYVLGVLTPQQLAHSMFPLGDSLKSDIRAEAEAAGLPVATKPDSHDICFIPSGDTRAFLGARIGLRPGAVVDADTGDELGRHDGVYGFTIGQRKGLGLPGPAPDGRPRYVTSIDAGTGTVTVGGSEHLLSRSMTATSPYWLVDDDIRETACQVQIRAHGDATPGHVRRVGDGQDARLEITLDEPVRGVAPGQAAVLYRPEPGGDRVLGSGTITASVPVAGTP
ncbi:tRNA 2-thiouridine(34) synthase MnmA [Dietzia psychralcaliphila]|uniref:tRNA-specific 2-thiouridylase MnmA n=1 Tax=Dietzia psychralcaliphila TaxID=139021 RepID=A0AAD0NMT9_9ACTN|nr:tRNA 2-thiouridine(34) synthase MnmA [Dietzia psychralcaliphila]AWH95740.1 tRNA 2-thiouridine(34) synthase MnmA [Dietzia psychralcaliphila]PTM88483.1 tRNA (5-methylaminomethyl-2-thiouridylate)-methyltransferase [Dietzia psychralcaliphila]